MSRYVAHVTHLDDVKGEYDSLGIIPVFNGRKSLSEVVGLFSLPIAGCFGRLVAGKPLANQK